MYYLGVDIGGTNIKAGIVDESGQIHATGSTRTVVDDLAGLVSTLAELIRNFQKTAAIESAGIGVPGFRSLRTGKIEASPNIPCLQDVSLETELAGRVQMPVVTENDANAAAYGEFQMGAGRGTQHMICLTLGTGLGSGLILDGMLFRGASGYGGEFGHVVVTSDGRPCSCGSQGCLETVVSATGIVLTALEKLADGRRSMLREVSIPLVAEAIYDAAKRGDELAIEVFEQTGRYLGLACANLINLFNPNTIVIAGGVMASGETLLQPAREEAERHSLKPSYDDCRIVQSELWPKAGIIGAALLARDR